MHGPSARFCLAEPFLALFFSLLLREAEERLHNELREKLGHPVSVDVLPRLRYQHNDGVKQRKVAVVIATGDLAGLLRLVHMLLGRVPLKVKNLLGSEHVEDLLGNHTCRIEVVQTG